MKQDTSIRALFTKDMLWKVAPALVGCLATGFIIKEKSAARSVGRLAARSWR